MTDCKEEQQSELEALEAIYADDFKLTPDMEPARFAINVNQEGGEGLKVILNVEYTPEYPNEVPLIRVDPISGIAKDKSERITQVLRQTAEENLGAVMVFTLVSTTLELLENLPGAAAPVEEEDSGGGLKKPKIDDSVAIKHGNLVTRELFAEWKQKFDVERAGWGAAKRAAKEKEMALKKDRLTGRQFFNKMSANIDWELFNAEDEDLDDLDFNDDDEDEGEESDD
mmetsp:Transcript_32798/g.58818  ORF Transcript_32798/g.58818 Transcript_32798/m.58818 type:complete len:227 (-) Transcript_32798:419-1099(-)